MNTVLQSTQSKNAEFYQKGFDQFSNFWPFRVTHMVLKPFHYNPLLVAITQI